MRLRRPRPAETFIPHGCDEAPVEHRQVYTFSGDQFKERLGLKGNPHRVLAVHIRWDGGVEVEMTSR